MSPLTPLLLLALTAIPGALQQRGSAGGLACTTCQEDIRESLTTIYSEIEQEVNRARERNIENFDKADLANSEATKVAEEFRAQVETLKNATAQLLEELSIVRSRQAASSAIQAFMALAFLAYLATIAVCYLVKRCKKHQKEVAKAEFELLEANLRSSKARRRAAAAQEKSAQAHSLE